MIHIASRKGYHNVVRTLAEFGVNPTAKDNSGQTALHLATLGGYNDTVTALLDTGIDVDVKNASGHTALFLAVDAGKEYIVRLLLEAGADPNITIPPLPVITAPTPVPGQTIGQTMEA